MDTCLLSLEKEKGSPEHRGAEVMRLDACAWAGTLAWRSPSLLRHLSTGGMISGQHLWKFLQEFTVVRSERSSSAIVRILDVFYDILGYDNRTN